MNSKFYLLITACALFSKVAFSQLLDTNFGQDSLLTISYQNTNYGSISWINNRLYGEVYDYGGTNYQFRVFDENGQPDLSFGAGGAITDAPFGASLVNNDGIYFTKMATSPFKATIKKYTLEGDVETDFGNSGTVVNTISTMNTNILGWNGVQYGADFIADDLFLYGKYMDTLCFLKYNADGILNSTYGQSGISKRTLAEIFPAGYSYQVRTVFVLNNQWHVQVAGTINNENPVLLLARLDVNGDWDLSFGTSGVVDMTTLIEETINEWGMTVFNYPYVRVLNSAAYLFYYDFGMMNTTMRICRCEVGSFTIDTSFGNNGYLSEPSISGYSATMMDSEHRIYMAGQLTNSNPAIAACTRFSENGVQDESFGTAGILTLNAPIEGNGIRFNRISFGIDDELYLSGNTGLFGVENGYSKLFCSKYGFEQPSNVAEMNSNGIVLYPNPANNSVTIANAGVGIVSIFSIDGKLMKQSRLNGSMNNSIDISDLPVEQYVLEFKGDLISHSKLIKE